VAIFKACTVICKSNILLIVEQVGTLVNWPMCDWLMNLLEISEVLGLSVYRSSTPYISESLKVKEGSIISYLQNI
jgi:hypothetical protein